MLALERRNLILEKLQTEKRVVVSELSQLYVFLKKQSAVIWTSSKKKDLQPKVTVVLS